MPNIQPNDPIAKTIKALTANKMEAFFAASHEELFALIAKLAPEGSSVSFGGSVTLKELKMDEYIQSHNYEFLDRNAPGVDEQKLFRQVYSADAYITSANAVSEQGDLFFVDGNGNRVSAVVFGPNRVIVVVGANKIVADEDAAWQRIRAVAAPLNAKRLERDTGCIAAGRCVDCRKPERVCCHYLRSSFQRIPDRIKVIILDEALGY